MDIATGIASLRAAAELTKSMRDAAKAGKLKPDEFVGRVGEIYDYIIDSRAALVDAQEEIATLRARIAAFNDEKSFRESVCYEPAGIYRRQGPHGDELYCSTCLDADNKRMRLQRGTGGSYRCDVHGYRETGD
jgi:hypothetical protein